MMVSGSKSVRPPAAPTRSERTALKGLLGHSSEPGYSRKDPAEITIASSGGGLGLKIASEPGQLGVRISGITKGAASDEAGLLVGDVILEVDGVRQPDRQQALLSRRSALTSSYIFSRLQSCTSRTNRFSYR